LRIEVWHVCVSVAGQFSKSDEIGCIDLLRSQTGDPADELGQIIDSFSVAKESVEEEEIAEWLE
jgi:hypothetical protein